MVLTACLLTGHGIGRAEALGPANAPQEESRHPIAFRGGAGFGVPYGFMGCQLGVAAGRFHESTAFGFVPWAWEPAVAHFESRGYVMENEQLSLGGPKISVGLLWSPPRTH